MLKILKPDEIRPEYLTDGSGHYLLAIHPQLVNLKDIGEKELKKIALKLEFPLFGYRPLPSALLFHRSKKRYRWAFGGNRSSKSFALAVEVIWTATGTHPFKEIKLPQKIWYATTTGTKVSDTLWAKLNPSAGGLLKGIPHKLVWQSRQYEIPNRVILTDTGSVIEFKSFEQGRENFQAVDLDFAAYDEQFDRDILTETLTRIGAGRELSFAAACTPLIKQPWLEAIDRKGCTNDTDVFHFSLDDNREEWGGFIKGTEIDAAIESWPPEVRETRRNGIMAAYEGSIYTTFRYDTHVISAEKERKLFLKSGKIEDEMGVIAAMDFGGANPFGFLWLTRIPWLDDDFYVFDELLWEHRVRGGRLLKDLASDILNINKKWGTFNFTRVWADHDPTDAREMANYGIPSLPAKKDVKLGIEHIQSLLQPRKHLINEYWPNGRPSLHISERCVRLIDEFSGYRWASGTDNRDPKDEPVKVDDHLLDALRMAVFSEKYLSIKPMNMNIDIPKRVF